MITLSDCVRSLNNISLDSAVRHCCSRSVNYLGIRGDIEKQRESVFPWESETLMSLAVLAYPPIKEKILNEITFRELIRAIRRSDLSQKHSNNKHLGKNLLSNIGLYKG